MDIRDEYVLVALNEKYIVLQGDSGGPLLVAGSDGKYSIVGVNSFSRLNQCIDPDYHARVTSFLDWIKVNTA